MKRFERIRLAVFAAVVALIVIGLVASVPAGTWSALGLDSIALLCPVGALSTLLGGKQLFVHMVLLLGLTVFLVVMVGKAFCAWVCPVPWTQRFFRPRKERAEKGKPHLLNHKQMERDDTQRLSELSAEGSDAECSTELSAAEKTSEASDSSAFSGCGTAPRARGVPCRLWVVRVTACIWIRAISSSVAPLARRLFSGFRYSAWYVPSA